jgi:hypothetical protein
MLTSNTPPQCGQEKGGDGASCVDAGTGVAPLVSAIMRLISGVVMAPLALGKPKWRTFMQPESRNLRLHSMTSRWVVRGWALPGWQYVHVTLWSWSETMRRLEMATLKEDRRGEVLRGRGAMRVGLAGHVPGGVLDLWGDLCDKPGSVHLFFEDGAGDRRQALDRHGEVGT